MRKNFYIASLLTLLLLLGTAEVVEAKSFWNRPLKNLTGTPWPVQARETRQQKYPFVNFAGIRWATIESIGTNFIVVKMKDEKTATLNITDKTVILKKFGGKSSMTELKVGDIVTAVGTWTQTDPPVLETKVLRDLSILKRKATFWGKIKSISGDTFVLSTIFRGELTIKTDGETKFVNRREETIVFSDLKEGHRVRVKGIWDQTLKLVEEVSLVKDWSVNDKLSF